MENDNHEVDAGIEAKLDEMSDEEMVGLCHAVSIFHSGGVERLGLGELIMSDGPHGVRAELEKMSFIPLKDAVGDETIYLPVGITLGSTWNIELAEGFGRVLGAEARARGKDVILGPGVNIVRTPLCGRNFEYLGEDPCHVGEIAVHIIRNIQANDVAANVKHFALNNQELNRHGVDVHVDERTLQELYLPAFRRAVVDGNCLTVMGAYNLFEGQHCCHHKRLLVDILKGDWDFRGLVISDWSGVHSTDEAAENGLDIEMGGDLHNLFLADAYLEGIRNKRYSREGLRDKARRNLRVRKAIKKGEPHRKRGTRLTDDHASTALEIAREGIVLLRNERDLIPLNPDKIKRIVVIGSNATVKQASGGGSSGIKAIEEITPLEGLKKMLPSHVEVEYIKGYPIEPKGMEYIPQSFMDTAGAEGIRGWRMSVYPNRNWQDCEPFLNVVTPSVEYAAQQFPQGRSLADWSIVWEGTLRVEKSGTYRLVCEGGDFLELHVDEKSRMSVWDLPSACREVVPLDLEAGEPVDLRVVYRPKFAAQGVALKWIPPWYEGGKALPGTEATLNAARDADVVLFFGGSDHRFDTEGVDRSDMRLPYEQDLLISALARANPNLIVTLFSGSAMELPWLDDVPAILFAGYPGQKGGRALAEIIFGEVVPSGRLPFSWPAKLEDVPAHHFGEYGPHAITYREGLRHGYRWLGREGPKPLFPFGFGLSTTRFELDEITIEQQGESWDVGCIVRNEGPRTGSVVLQCYVSHTYAPVPVAERRLVAFAKIKLQAGESRAVSLPVNKRDFMYWDVTTSDWLLAGNRHRLTIALHADDPGISEMLELSER